MCKWKARLVTLLIVVLLILLAADVVAIWPRALPYILGAFAVPGVWKFARVLYIWLTTDSDWKVQFNLKKKPFAWKKGEEA